MSHDRRPDPTELLDPRVSGQVAETMHALGTPSRLRILGRLHTGECYVAELSAAVGMEASAVSHQLRVLRHLRLVSARRSGRQVFYGLHDEHVGQLLEEAMSHVEHLGLGLLRAV